MRQYTLVLKDATCFGYAQPNVSDKLPWLAKLEQQILTLFGKAVAIVEVISGTGHPHSQPDSSQVRRR